MKRGRGSRPLLESEIREAQDNSKSGAEAARLLEVHYTTYKKWAKKYDILERNKNQGNHGVRKGNPFEGGKYQLSDIFAGEYPDYPNWKLKKRLFSTGLKPEKCECCGFDEKRLVDDRLPLQLTFKDGDKTNKKFENLEVLCYNCYFLQVGNLNGRRKLYLYT